MWHKIHRFWSWLCFPRWWNIRKTFLGSFRHHTALLSVWKKRNGCEKTSKDSWCWTGVKKRFHSSLVKFPLVNISAIWFFGVNNLIWILGSELILSNNQSVCPGNMSHGSSSPFYDHFDNCLVIFKTVQTGYTMRRVFVHRKRIKMREINMFGRHLLGFGCDLWSCSSTVVTGAMDIGN